MRPRRTILITGCSSPQGIGFATARALAQDGHRVHATVRDHTNDSGLLDGLADRLTIHNLDLRDHATMGPLVDSLSSAGASLDVLINNAGYGVIGGIEQVELDRARESFETNFFGTMALIQEALPVMRSQRSGHIINVSTIFAAGLCPPAIGYYIASKAALETACQALAIELDPWHVRVTNFQPGPVMTDLSREWGTRLAGDDDPRPALSNELYKWVLGDDGPDPQSAQQVAGALCQLVDSEAPELARQSGPAAHAYVAAALRDPAREAELAALKLAFAKP